MGKARGGEARAAAGSTEAQIKRWLGRLSNEDLAAIRASWMWQAHDGQLPPPGGWRTWLLMAGRGFGKTRAGAEWVSGLARRRGDLRIALVGASLDEVARVMVCGQSGLMAVADKEEDVVWYPSRGLLQFHSGAQAFAYSGAHPEGLRGPEHHYAWCDEMAKWAYPEANWDNLMLGLRLGAKPRTLVTTTPRPTALLKRVMGAADTERTGGPSGDNPHLPADFLDRVTAHYGATRLGRQEIGGEMIEEVDGALWSRALIEAARTGARGGRTHSPLHHGPLAGGPPPRPGVELARVVIGVDPPAGTTGDACGIVACAVAEDGTGLVLGDHSVAGASPEGWARAVVGAAEAWGADRVIAEANQGGAMVESVLRAADCALPVRLVHARRGKSARAEPIAALFECNRVRLGGAFPELEDQLCGMMIGGGYQGPGRSPDRADAMVWALTELMLGRRGEPRVLGL